jgi:hypothetical protein
MPAEAEWFANLDDPRTRGAYRVDLQDFMGFAGITPYFPQVDGRICA